MYCLPIRNIIPNLVPWLKLQKAGRIKVDHTEPDDHDGFDLSGFEQKMKNNRVRLVSMAYTSNATGYTIPAQEIVKIAHHYGALVLLDSAQAAPATIDVQQLDVDFLAFPCIRCADHGGRSALCQRGASRVES